MYANKRLIDLTTCISAVCKMYSGHFVNRSLGVFPSASAALHISRLPAMLLRAVIKPCDGRWPAELVLENLTFRFTLFLSGFVERYAYRASGFSDEIGGRIIALEKDVCPIYEYTLARH